jgi:hypothetical protein
MLFLYRKGCSGYCREMGRQLFWKGVHTMTRLLDVAYEKGVKVCGDEKAELEQRLHRSLKLHWWDITIQPKMVNL